MKNLGIIPARSGSKGLVDKNIMKVNGKPLMHYTIEAAIQSGCFDEVMVSTDSIQYGQIAEQSGAKVPFLRLSKTATDEAGSWDVVREVLKEYQRRNQTFDYISLLQPTSPLRDAQDIRQAFDCLSRFKATNLASVVETAHPVQWCFQLPENHRMDQFAKSPFAYTRRQDLPSHYYENGAIYIVDANKIMNQDYNFYEDNCYAFIMEKMKSIDIDEEIDIYVVEKLLTSKNK